jgi:ribosome maturation factor RimP
MNIIDKIEQWVTEKIEGTSYFIVEIERNRDNSKAVVYLDGDEGVPIDACTQVSKYVRFRLGELEEAGEDIDIAFEISSPGIDKPLRLKRQYVKNRGRQVKMKLKNSAQISGKLVEVEDDAVTVDELTKNSGKKPVSKMHRILFDDIAETIISVQFK